MTEHDFNMNERAAEKIHALIDSHIKAIKNWLASAVERDDTPYAKQLVADLREYEELYRLFNTKAKREIAKVTQRPMVVNHSQWGR